MRLHDDRRLHGFLRTSAAACGALAFGLALTGANARPALPVAASTGPLADYPIVVGPAYSVAGTGFTPEDVLNYDQVGLAAAERAGGGGITGSHHTLPLPSYVEVTSLATGRTILVRLERRGPMDGTELIALSPGALAQLGAAPGTPVRVRRVVPPEEQRALLRAGQSAPLRMDTPMSLVDVLKRKLPGQGSTAVVLAPTVPRAGPVPVAVGPSSAAHEASPGVMAAPAPALAALDRTMDRRRVPALPPLASRGSVAPAPVVVSAAHSEPPRETAPSAPSPSATARAPVPSVAGKFVVQAGAFSTSDRASKVAHVVGGDVSRSGTFYRVRTGPFATRLQAEASLAKVRAAGYSDARIQTSG